MVRKNGPLRRFRYAVPVAVGLTAVVGIGVAVAAGGAGPKDPAATFQQHSGAPMTYARSTHGPQAHLAPSTAARQVLAGLGSDSPIRGVTVTPGNPAATISVDLGRNDEDPATQWLSELAVGAIGELTRSDQATINEEFFRAVAVGPNRAGVATTTGLGVGAATLGQKFDSPSDATITSHVDDVAARYGLTVGSVQVLHPLESAVRVTFVVPTDAKVDWTIDQLRTALVGGTPDVEGAFIELVSPNGDPLLRAGTSYRTANGILWFAPGQDDRFGAVHGGLDSRGEAP